MRANTRTRTDGFTLIELMIVVCIVGILASIGLPLFAKYVGVSRTSEATGFLQEVKARQESYRFDFGMYCNVSASRGAFFPEVDPDARSYQWDPGASRAGWDQLGAMPSGGQSRFVYSSVASGPGATPPLGLMPQQLGFTDNRGYLSGPQGPMDFWFITTAVGDLNGNCGRPGATDLPCNMVFESYSHTRGIYSSVGEGYE